MTQATVEIPIREIAEHAITLAFELGEIEENICRELKDDWNDNIGTTDLVKGVDSAKWEDDSVWFEGTVGLHEVVDYIPAGPNRGYGPINPPEWITRERTAYFTVRWWPEDLGHAEMCVEA